MSPDPKDELIGQVVADRYQVLRLIGRGGMGAVYEARHLGLGKPVAIKVLLRKLARNREAIERFHREAINTSRIGHDHVVDMTDIGYTADGRTFVVMELLEGRTLGRLIEDMAPLPALRAVYIIRQLLRGLGAAHDRGVVHRDVKPDNIFLVRQGSDMDYVKILDFGVSRIIDGSEQQGRLTKTGMVVGTPVYMAPEQAMGTTIDFRADLYSVGVIFYEMLAGRPPFFAPNYVALMTQHIQGTPPDITRFRPDIGPVLAGIVHRSLSKDPRDRWAHAEEMIAALPTAGQLSSMDVATTLGPHNRGVPSTSPPPMSALAAPPVVSERPAGMQTMPDRGRPPSERPRPPSGPPMSAASASAAASAPASTSLPAAADAVATVRAPPGYPAPGWDANMATREASSPRAHTPSNPPMSSATDVPTQRGKTNSRAPLGTGTPPANVAMNLSSTGATPSIPANVSSATGAHAPISGTATSAKWWIVAVLVGIAIGGLVVALLPPETAPAPTQPPSPSGRPGAGPAPAPPTSPPPAVPETTPPAEGAVPAAAGSGGKGG